MPDLNGKVMIVAGGATGIGAETARQLAESGASVVVGDVALERAEQTAADIRATGGAAEAVGFDLGDEPSIAALVTGTVERHGRLDGLHLNGVDTSQESQVGDLDALDVDLDTWDRVLRINLRGYLLGIRFAVPELLAGGGGAIVCTSSGVSLVGEATRVSYGVSKAGINALVRHVASRWGKEGIRANAVAPGLVLSDLMRTPEYEPLRNAVLKMTRSPRLGETSDIASMVRFLLSDEAAWINGQVISVDGGATQR